jgi:hypothetical protein
MPAKKPPAKKSAAKKPPAKKSAAKNHQLRKPQLQPMKLNQKKRLQVTAQLQLKMKFQNHS